METLLAESGQWRGGKQRLRATRLHALLTEEGHRVGVTLVKDAVAERKAWLFLLRLLYSGRDFAWIYERQDQISFLDGHVRAFAHFAQCARAPGLRYSARGRRADPRRR